MTEIHVDQIIDEVRRMCIEANVNLPPDVCRALEKAVESEGNPTASSVLELLLENADIARNECIPICQDTGMAVFFVEVGQDCRIVGGGLTDASTKASRLPSWLSTQSIVSDPLEH